MRCRLRMSIFVYCAAAALAPAATAGTSAGPPAETPAMQRIVASFERVVKREYASSGAATRDAHAKGHGCIRGVVAIRSGLPQALRRGVFAAPRTYRAWIRYSNGSGEIRTDSPPDGRGMAVKLVGVSGRKIIADEHRTQDFVMINFPIFFITGVDEYESLAVATEKKTIPAFFAANARSAKIAADIGANQTHDLLTDRYFSMTPYLLGDTYVKFGAFPVDCKSGAAVAPRGLGVGPGANYLRERLGSDLSQREACFDLRLQPRTDAGSQPLDDATILWSEAAAPFVTVARITIPAQAFDSPAQQQFCENLSYTPWHATTDFRPVGGLNDLRFFVYRAISQLRRALNQGHSVEPTGTETFPR